MNPSIEFAGLKLKNPTMNASGILDETGDSMVALAKAGAGAVVTKSIGIKGRDGHKNPTVIVLEHGMINAMGLPNPGIDEYGEEIRIAKSAGVPVIASIFGGDPGEFGILAKRMQEYGADAVELNVSCPHAKGFGAQLGTDPVMVTEVVKAAKSAAKIPVFVKLTPNVNNIVPIAKAAEAAGADGIVAINTVKAMSIDLETGMPILGNKLGGYSGPAVKPIGVRAVYDIAKEVKIPIIGVGGITTGEDAIEYIMAGAT
ncbi:MAG: dihydroorotate dehydrogenase, partial [Candidatus Thermoplasmatota archaeon]|nr:dihydroorotate dehydrogenase [Candidatus Thermoplasmatota archaeon]